MKTIHSPQKLTFRDIIDNDGNIHHTDVDSRDSARKYKQELRKEGITARIIRSDYVLAQEVVER